MRIPQNIGAVILAAGKGTRLGCDDKPKVMLEIGNKPIVEYTVSTLQSVGFSQKQICLVVGFAAGKIKSFFRDRVIYATQSEQIGTGHAAYVGMRAFPDQVDTILVLGGDDSAFYSKQTIQDFISFHADSRSTVSLLSVERDLPHELGRVITGPSGELLAVKEKEQVEGAEVNITEVSTGTYCFNRSWYENAFLNMPIIEKLGEYGLNTSITMARDAGHHTNVFKVADPLEWFGINTPEELAAAHELKIKKGII